MVVGEELLKMEWNDAWLDSEGKNNTYRFFRKMVLVQEEL